ncbi:MAG: hydrolase 2, exosortase A system-associated [Rubrivivax sp.]|nr:hydrolase 2, exosortase A system-associated [Rubrivivax sp.]
MSRPSGPEPFFLPDASGGHRFCVSHEPEGEPRALVLHCHAFGEELNRSRRVVARCARALAGDGAAVLQMDLKGCGDSSGASISASWQEWEADVRRGASWLKQRHPGKPLWLWAHRAGALLALRSVLQGVTADHMLLWQPVVKGEDLVKDWIRQRSASAIAEGRGAQSEAAAMRASWEGGEAVEVMGYPVSADLYDGCKQPLSPVPPVHAGNRLVVVEVSQRPRSPAATANAERLSEWQQAGWSIEQDGVTGPAFWVSPEIVDAPELVTQTCHILFGRAAPQ